MAAPGREPSGHGSAEWHAGFLEGRVSAVESSVGEIKQTITQQVNQIHTALAAQTQDMKTTVERLHQEDRAERAKLERQIESTTERLEEKIDQNTQFRWKMWWLPALLLVVLTALAQVLVKRWFP